MHQDSKLNQSMRKQGSEEREFRTVTKREKKKRKKIYLELFFLPCSATRERKMFMSEREKEIYIISQTKSQI
jgi:hypothetical protein